ncbi:MAG: LysR family transcriptional regulator [Burkholderiaceae bacterium]
MNFDQIQSFYLIAKLGTFAAAAQRLNTTQPAISARIAALETGLGIRLFDRSGHRAVLTPAGRRFLQSAEKLLSIRSEILAQAGLAPLGGVMRIGASDTLAVSWLPGFLADLRQAFPDTIFELEIATSPRLRTELIERRIDLAFMVGPVTDAEIGSTMLCEHPMVLAAPPTLALPREPLDAAALEGLNLVTFERMTRPHQELIAALRRMGIAPHVHSVNSLQAIILMICNGFGVGAVPRAVITRELAEGRLRIVESALTLPSIPFAACHVLGPDAHVGSSIAARAHAYLATLPASPDMQLLS